MSDCSVSGTSGRLVRRGVNYIGAKLKNDREEASPVGDGTKEGVCIRRNTSHNTEIF